MTHCAITKLTVVRFISDCTQFTIDVAIRPIPRSSRRDDLPCRYHSRADVRSDIYLRPAHGSKSVGDLIDELDIPERTAYDYVHKLDNAGILQATTDTHPVTYIADEIDLTLKTEPLVRFRRRSNRMDRQKYVR
jgi:hypothetical protein